MPVEEFYATRKPRYDAFLIPDPRPNVDDFYRELRKMWQLPDVCQRVEPLAVLQAKAVSLQQAVEARFLELADQWDRETSFLSSTPKKVLHESYQSIMAMGPDVVPYLLRDLERNRRSWFWALRHLTRVNPVPQQDQGNLDKMIAAWVEWGRNERLI